ncbi:hypothetical protein LEN26_006393 [Aphanomyces euteiches]|nr:hypothetical protein AeMF1_016474 [Aphanomyces euteiches]KAH9135579.1 hypothetical protein LEN26_006393 [Aphanomyces euteiches]KAH9193854.1 hypothetical protein AeNC1_004168 [Aphanomyces euteiches]
MSNKRRRTDKTPQNDANDEIVSISSSANSIVAEDGASQVSAPMDGAKLLAEMDTSYPYLASLLKEFRDELNVPPTTPIASDERWFWFMEMKFVITFLHQMSYMELGLSSTKPDSMTQFSQNKEQKNRLHLCDRDEMIARLDFMERLLAYVSWVGAQRLAITTPMPRVHRLAKHYELTEKELELFQLMVIFQGCQSSTVRSQMIEEDCNRKMMTFQRLACISEIDIEEFYEDTRPHVKEGTVIAEVDNYTTVLTLSSICVRVMLGRTLTPNHMLKVSQTALESLLREEGCMVEQVLELSEHLDQDGEDVSDDDAPNGETVVEDDAVEDDKEDDVSSFIGNYKNRPEKEPLLPQLTEANALLPYNPDNQLEYLEDRFQVVAFAIRASGARVKDQMKEAGTKQPWGDSYGNTMNAGRRELKAKQRVQDRKVTHRLTLTRAAQLPLPRLEEMATKFKLNAFEQNVIVMLIGKTISPVLKNLLEGVDTSVVQRMDESITVNQILSVFCDTFQEQVAHRVFFYKSARLLQKGLVKLNRGRWHSSGGDLVDQRVELDRRVLDWVVGLDTEINELVEGSDLYNPKVQLNQVVLPDEYKQTILSTVTAYEHFRTYRKTSGLDQTLSYGTGLVLLLCGASGTGKTMTVNAVAHHLKKRVLLVDFPSLQGKASQDRGGECDADLRGLFREADMSNAILFFDECESIFKQREMGGDRLLNALLTEMERYEGIVFLATNRPFDLDEAMHRRITAVFEYKAPDHLQRREIWRVLISDKLKCSPDIDWESISLKYELSGGFIKNAILSALLKAIGRDPKDPVITHEDIVAGCALQMRGSLHMKTFDHRVVPTSGLDSLIVDESVKTILAEVVQFEKARNVIYGQWNFDFGLTTKYNKKNQKGISVLLVGPAGVGKISAAKAIGFEVGRPLKLVHFAQLQCDSPADTRRAIESTFQDARLMDAVLVLEGFEMFGMDVHGQVDPDSPRFRVEAQRLMDMVDNFPGISILIATTSQSVSNLDSEFSRRLKFVVEMRPPTPALRTKLWKSFFPPSAPLAKDVDFEKLGVRFDLSNDAISNAVFRAAASAALRPEETRQITMKDLMEAATHEKKKGRNNEMRDRLFV